MTAELTNIGFLPPKKVSPWRNIGAAVAYFLFYLTVQYLASAVYYLYLALSAPAGLDVWEQTYWIQEQYTQGGNLLMIVLDLILLGAMILWFLLRRRPVMASLGLKKPRMISLPLALVAGIGMSCLLNYVMVIIGELFPQVIESYGESMDATYNMQDMLLYALAGVVGAPLIEELFFRQLMAGRLSRAFPRVVAILLSSAIFGLVHQHPLQMAYAGVLGFAMACVYFAYDSIWVSIFFHMGFNAVSLLAFIDVSEMSEARINALDQLLGNLYMTFTVLGIAALILLFLLRTHTVFRKPSEKAPAVVLEAPAPIPGVAPAGEGYFTQPAPARSAAADTDAVPGVSDLSVTETPANEAKSEVSRED